MALAELEYSDPFGTGMLRPYLVVHLTGINGAPDGSVIGLLDSGADSTCLPMGFASLMGYSANELETVVVGTAGAPTTMRRALTPCQAYVAGIPSVSMSLRPVFGDGGSGVLWGRTDVMATFDVTIRERRLKFVLEWDE